MSLPVEGRRRRSFGWLMSARGCRLSGCPVSGNKEAAGLNWAGGFSSDGEVTARPLLTHAMQGILSLCEWKRPRVLRGLSGFYFRQLAVWTLA